MTSLSAEWKVNKWKKEREVYKQGMNETSKESKLFHIYPKQLKRLNGIRNSTVCIASMKL